LARGNLAFQSAPTSGTIVEAVRRIRSFAIPSEDWWLDVARLRVAYFTNGVGRLPRAPCLVTLYQQVRYGDYSSDFQSNYGKVAGAVAPREAGSFWGRFFDLERYAAAGELGSDQARVLRRTVHCLQRLCGDVLFVNKNVKHMLRIEPLAEIFPRSVFLVVERDLADVALSVLRGRHESQADPRQSWSVRPPNYRELQALPVHEQVAGQLVSLQKRLDEDLSRLAAARVLRVGYEDFCGEPEALIGTLRHRFGPIGDRNPATGPFEVRRRTPRTDEERRLLAALLQTVAT
jgi:hypothetical protein